MKQKFLAYDWFKLIVLLLLIILLIVLHYCAVSPKYSRGDNPPPRRGEPGHKEKKGPDDRQSDSKDSMPKEEKALEEKEEESLDGTDDPSGIEESEIAADDGENETGDLSDYCPDALPIRIDKSGINAKIVNADIPLRSSPEVAANIIFMMTVGTEVEIISEKPVCTAFLSGANNWWEVKTSDGSTGFAAEGSAINPIYYLDALNNQ